MADPTPVDADAFKTLEHDGWVEVGGNYHSHFAHVTQQATEPLLDAAGVTAGMRVLDVACGPGYVSAAAAKRGAKTVGVDFSSTMVAEARRLNPGLEFREGDAEALAFGDGEFDAVVIAFGMLHFARPEKALAEAHRLLKPGGRLAFSVWDLPERAIVFGIVLRAIEEHGEMDVGLPTGPPFFRFADPEESPRTLAAAGFVEPRISTIPVVWRLDRPEDLLRSFLDAGVRTRALLRAQRPEALGAITVAVTKAASEFKHAGLIELPAPAVIVAARRP